MKIIILDEIDHHVNQLCLDNYTFFSKALSHFTSKLSNLLAELSHAAKFMSSL